jgi:putative toxin-antitoxin system antitoxin component (TIGR02293 family)
MVQEASVPYSASLRSRIRDLAAGFGFAEADLAAIFDVTPRTITRWKERDELLSAQKQDVMHILYGILALGRDVLGSDEDMRRWLHEPVFSLEGRKPADIVKTESGRRRVENVLRQIEAGAY